VTGAIHAGRDVKGDLRIDADVVIVGSGAGGAVVAAELAEAGERVVILEEGPHVRPEQLGAWRPSETLRHVFRDGAVTAALGLGDTPMINVTMGRCVGGSSVVTGGVCFRVPEKIIATWATDHGLEDVTSRTLEPCYDTVEKAIHVEEVPEVMRSQSTRLFGRGTHNLGFEIESMHRNTRDCNGCGRCNFGCPHGAKLSVDLTYLPRALAAGANIYSDCLIDRVLTSGDRAVGVVGSLISGAKGRRRGKVTVHAKRVVIAAGSVHTPMILQRTGLGRASGQLGRNITLHPGFRVLARFDETVRGWQGALQSAFTDHYEHERITMMSLFIPPGVLAAQMAGFGDTLARKAASIPNLAMFGGIIHDEGGGSVHRFLGREPVLAYRMSAEDRAVMPLLLRRMAAIWFAAGAREVFLPVFGAPGMDADALARYPLEQVPARKFECASQHPLGSCRMGVSPQNSVVDSYGRAWELNGLWVADGSIVPTSLGVNPQITIMSIATRVAWKMREQRHRDLKAPATM